MTKKEFTQLIATNLKCTDKEADKFIAAFNEVMVNEVFKKEDSVKFDFGTLKGVTKKTSERTAHNPKTGETILVPAHTFKGLPKLVVAKSMKVEE